MQTGLNNVAPSRALERQASQLLQLGLVVIAVGAFVAVVGVALSVVRLVPRTVTEYDTVMRVVIGIGVIIAVVGLGLAIRAITWRTDNDLALITGNFLAQELDSQYWFIRNISKIGLGYIDAVLVGPPGALVFRISDRDGTFANEGADWLQQNEKNEWLPAPRMDLTREAVQDIKALRDYLARRGLVDIPVYGVIVFIKDAPAVFVKDPVVPVTRLNSLIETLEANYLAKSRIEPRIADEVLRVLYDRT